MNQRTKFQVAEKIADFMCQQYTVEATASDLILVFGRQDQQLAEIAARMYKHTKAKSVVVTGGVGKDSGVLTSIGLTEAGYLTALMMQSGIEAEAIFPEYMATNGVENCRNSLALMQNLQLNCRNITVVAHWASLYRLSELFRFESRKLALQPVLQLISTSRPAKLAEKDVDELIAEFRRLMDWPAKSWLDPIDLPEGIIEMVRGL